jgi:hypothetical protein
MSKQAGSLGGVGTSGVGTLGALDPDLSDSDSSSSESNLTISLVSNETRLGRRRKTTTRRTIVSKDASTLRTMPTSVINDQPGLKSDMIDEEVNELVNEVARRRTCRGCFCFHQKSPATSVHDAAQQRKGRMAVMLACFCTFSMGGVVFGISSLFPLLYQQGFWRSLCDGTKQCTRSTKKCCESQLVRYSLVASISFFFADGAAAGWGELADRKGPWVCLLFASSLSVSGFVSLTPPIFLVRHTPIFPVRHTPIFPIRQTSRSPIWHTPLFFRSSSPSDLSPRATWPIASRRWHSSSSAALALASSTAATSAASK